MIQVVKSLSIVVIVSAFLGGCGYLLDYNFFAIFGITFIGQFIIYDLFSRWRRSGLEIEFRRLENERIKAENAKMRV